MSCSKKNCSLLLTSLYCQIDRVAIGFPLDPTLENAFLCHYEKEWFAGHPIEFKPKLYKRFVNDIFVIFQPRDCVKKFVDYMNTKHFNICFTFEIQDQNIS